MICYPCNEIMLDSMRGKFEKFCLEVEELFLKQSLYFHLVRKTFLPHFLMTQRIPTIKIIPINPAVDENAIVMN